MPARVTLAVVATLSVVGATACAEEQPAALEERATVRWVADGDSLVLEKGSRIRLLQIDAPELGQGECFGREALEALQLLLQPGDKVVLEADSRLDRVDRHGRLLRYVHSVGTNLNLELVRRGAATPYFTRGEQGRYAEALLAEAQDARDEHRGLWGECSVTWDPRRQVETRYR